ncbi:MAG: exodeoxyribonuclease VII large subunit [bacterium]|nr:exodeoxyribonuclease VII large subunit [bacterium]
MQSIDEVQLGVSDAVALLNNTLETVYPRLTVVGELINFRISKNKWVYFDIADEYSKLHCFGTIYMLPGPLQEGMLVQVVVAPRLHPQFGFTANLQSIIPVGEGSIKKASDLLKLKLEKEGLFETSRKRKVPAIPSRIALVTSDESAAYTDFIKITKARWPLVSIDVYSVLVQGVNAPEQIVNALQSANGHDELADVLVLTRGGGGADDLAAFDDERVVRAVAASRIPTVVAIGHERDFSLSELVADLRASTPSNAAEILVPNRQDELRTINDKQKWLNDGLKTAFEATKNYLESRELHLYDTLRHYMTQLLNDITHTQKLLTSLNPEIVLKRGYTIVRSQGRIISKSVSLKKNAAITVSFSDGDIEAKVQ